MIIQNRTDLNTVIYQVSPGDNLSRIIQRYYGNISPQKQKSLIQQIMLDNPNIKQAHLIYSGQQLQLNVPSLYAPYPAPVITEVDSPTLKTLSDNLEQAPPAEKKLQSALAPILLGSGATGMTLIKQTFSSNTPLLSEIADNYNAYKADNISKGQYDYRRKKMIQQLNTKLGPLQRLLNGHQPLGEVLRISRKKDTAPNHVMHQQAKQMSTLAKAASRGSVVLSAVGLGVACHQMANTDNAQKKNEIMVESLGGLLGGAVLGAIVTVVFIGTPVGWVAALAIGVGSVATSYGFGVGAKKAYTKFGSHIDFATLTHANELCR